MNDQLASQVRDALKRLPTDYLLRGMDAFSHPPRACYWPVGDDMCGCFVGASCGYTAARRELALVNTPGVEFPWHTIQRLVGPESERALSCAYESYQDEFRSECIRELAERGVVPEPGVLHETRREE